jgi:hypothetical protein
MQEASAKNAEVLHEDGALPLDPHFSRARGALVDVGSGRSILSRLVRKSSFKARVPVGQKALRPTLGKPSAHVV